MWPPLAGGLEYRTTDGTETSLAIFERIRGELQGRLGIHASTPWAAIMSAFGSLPEELRTAPKIEGPAAERRRGGTARHGRGDALGTYVEAARLLGERTARDATSGLASDKDDKDFAPEAVQSLLSTSAVSIHAQPGGGKSPWPVAAWFEDGCPGEVRCGCGKGRRVGSRRF